MNEALRKIVGRLRTPWGWGLLLLLALTAAAPARQAEEPPLVGQPENFSGAVGRFRIAATPSLTDLRAEDTLVLDVRIESIGWPGQAPRRPDLRSLPRFKSRFVIQDLPARDVSTTLASGRRWEFFYSLKPRSPEVTEVPPLLFVYYKPGVVPSEKGYWTTATRSIPLKVRPRGRATLVDRDGRPLRAPESMYRLGTGPGVLRRDRLVVAPGMVQIVFLVLVPPLACVGWYLAWRRLYPDAARLARIRYSQAAQTALAGVRGSRSSDAAFRAVEGYLRNRLGIVIATPTPDEVLARLRATGVSEEMAGKLAAFFRDCDAVRFAAVPASVDLPGIAETLVLALESETCSQPLS